MRSRTALNKIHELLEKQRRYLTPYFERLDCDRVQEIVERLCSCRGTVIFSGVGKSGHIAQKIVATFVSTGTKAFFLDPMHAVHGDLGYVCESDLFFALSKSGSSQELLDLVPFIAKRGATTIAVVSNGASRLAKMCDHCVVLPVERELCPFDLSPTISTVVQLLFGDCLAVAIMVAKGISLTQLALNHPGGAIGKTVSLKVNDLMIKGEALPLCSPYEVLLKVLPELSARRCGCLLMVDEQLRMQGIFTDGDLRRAIGLWGVSALQKSVGELMIKEFCYTRSDQLACEALRQMEERKAISVLPVLGEEGRVEGLLRLHDLVQAGVSIPRLKVE